MGRRRRGEERVDDARSATIFTIAESPVKEGVLFAGTDDGRVQISEDGGAHWRAIDHFPGVPDTTFVSRVVPSQHDVNTVYATFNNHQSGDFKPYVVKTTDLGRTWTNITGDLPARGYVWSFAEDHVDRNLLFVGTEFGLFFTNDGGKKWTQLKGGLPTIQVRDIAIQRRENDLVLATFGRGFYVLDDYSPLRVLNEQTIVQAGSPSSGRSANASCSADPCGGPEVLFPVRAAPLYVESSPLGLPGKSFQGAGHYTASNPPYGAMFTYYLKDALESRKDKRQKAESAAAKKNADVFYPPWDSLKTEDRAGGSGGDRDGERREWAGRASLHRAGERGDQSSRVGSAASADRSRERTAVQAGPRLSVHVAAGRAVRASGHVPGCTLRSASTACSRRSALRSDFKWSTSTALPGRVMATLAEQQKIAELERSVLGTSALDQRDAARVSAS